MVSSQNVATEQHVRGCHGYRNGSARTIVIGVGERLCRSGRMVLQSLLMTVSTCTFQAVLFLCELSDHHHDDTFDTVDSLPTPTGAVLLIIRGQTVSSPATSSHKTDVRNSACRVNSYLDTYLSTHTAGCQSCCSCSAIVAAPPQGARRELAVLVYLVKRIERG